VRPGIAAAIHRRMLTARNPAVTRSPTCWRGCKPAHPGAAGVDAAKSERNHFAKSTTAKVKF
jgi:hypothetical protein